MAPLNESSNEHSQMTLAQRARAAPVVAFPNYRSGLFGLSVVGHPTDDAIVLARALRRAVMARVQIELGRAVLGSFFTGHEPNGEPMRTEHASHLAFHWDSPRRRLLVVAPHWLDRREPSRNERDAIAILGRALESMFELRAGSAGRFEVRVTTIAVEDPLRTAARSWSSLTPYAVSRHNKRSSGSEALVDDALAECRRRNLPAPSVTVLSARGIPGQGLEGQLRLDFAVAVTGPIALGRTRYLGGGLFAPTLEGTTR
jgi:CRISPR-associated protein Csb2